MSLELVLFPFIDGTKCHKFVFFGLIGIIRATVGVSIKPSSEDGESECEIGLKYLKECRMIVTSNILLQKYQLPTKIGEVL